MGDIFDISSEVEGVKRILDEGWGKGKEVIELIQPDDSILHAEVIEGAIPILFGASFTSCTFPCPSCASPLAGYTANHLDEEYREVIEGDFDMASVGTRGVASGGITVNVPSGATIKDAWLYWNIFATEGVDASMIKLGGTDVTGEAIGVVGNTCWPCNCNFPGCPPAPSTEYGCPPSPWVQLKNTVYKADVGPGGVGIVTSGGSYVVSDIPFTPGMETCGAGPPAYFCSDNPKFPGCCGSQGATIIFTYTWDGPGDGPTDPKKRFREVTIRDGSVHLAPNGTDVCWPGPYVQEWNFMHGTDYIFYPRSGFAAGDAQSLYADRATFNGIDLAVGDSSYWNPTAGLLLHNKVHGYNGEPPILTAWQYNYINSSTTQDCVCWYLWAYSGGDPHFYGFENDQFDVNGEPDKHYNLFTDNNIQINSYFRKWDDTWTGMGRIGIKVGKNGVMTRILFDAYDGVYVNGAEFERKVYFRTGKGSYVGYMEEIDVWNDVRFKGVENFEGFGNFIKGYLIITENYRFIVAVCTDGAHGYFLNFLGELRSEEVRPHGIVGQTADFDGKARISTDKQGVGAIDGVYTDYEVSDLWADDFKFNLYKGGKVIRWI
jgi:hypothetical protein